jgi:processive 1,2-diacylglycerol beta-glucosyltransferase
VAGPAVREIFGAADRAAVDSVRRRHGIPRGKPVALLVAGAWGVGEVDHVAREVAGAGRYLPVVVCGRNEALRARLSRDPRIVALGWVDDMAGLMRVADVLVQNAGGLSSLEAFAAGLPVVSYRCLAGHGRDNAEAMARAGVALQACTRPGLREALAELDDLGARRLRNTATTLFRDDPAAAVEEFASEDGSGAPARLPSARRGRPLLRLATAAALTGLFAMLLSTHASASQQHEITTILHTVEHRVSTISHTTGRWAGHHRRKAIGPPAATVPVRAVT